MKDPWADVRNQIRTDPEWWPEVRRLLADADALLRTRRALENTVRHFREDNCTEAGNCPYLDAADNALAALPEHLR